ncbi:hypothetical protein [Alistipes sp. ZOR0009]|uniref:hypothetical protein n=1 Tax=Alistipes sp. ZOR0009 TaxID=1339253 RepID=UPI00064812B3|nr:hypothetical protein [Alistipes sp. ZOR0009]
MKLEIGKCYAFFYGERKKIETFFFIGGESAICYDIERVTLISFMELFQEHVLAYWELEPSNEKKQELLRRLKAHQLD